ncbi:DUF1643 domain-containing protein [Lacibacter sediminis]|uniref:DUF1643 domain-containing protein n=1 Tax=Lacibacter sediminis TaxID=2760713 RepID=A0A7G5XLW8_9BACT|nr:DUF1643 domain-containing protein [Lacibacter sediminis]QNA46471.1 DUF1643 domain-containing protein [Lacibacter sediminis]
MKNHLNDKWLYEINADNSARYLLGTVGKKPLICFGINPSTAEPNKLDSTLRSVERLCISNGHDSWFMLNIYPQRATNPDGLHHDLDLNLHQNNLKIIKSLFEDSSQRIIWAAWGTLIEKRPYLIHCLADILKCTPTFNTNWITIGNISKKGHPHHPLYLSSANKPKPFDIHKYVKDRIR